MTTNLTFRPYVSSRTDSDARDSNSVLCVENARGGGCVVAACRADAAN